MTLITTMVITIITILVLPLTVSASPFPWSWLSWSHMRVKRAPEGIPEEGYYNPNEYGGSMFTKAPNSHPPDSGEPLNVIISANSDSRVLEDIEANGGLRNYFTSFQFSGECLGQHQGEPQTANLGDGEGDVDETAVIRYNYHDPQLGTCHQTIVGGNHFRYWVQENTKAVFCAFGYEKSIKEYHSPIFNGYTLGRDWAVGNISQTEIPTPELTNSSTYSGETSFNGYTYQTNIRYVSGLMENSSIGINHNWSVSDPGRGVNAVDGLVAVFDVYIVGEPEGNTAVSFRRVPSLLLGIGTLVFAFTCLSFL